MADANNDGWEDVSDPTVVAKVLGKGAATKMLKPSGGVAHTGTAGAPMNIDTPVEIPKGQAAQGALVKVGAARQMLKQLGRVKGLYDKNMSSGGLAGLAEYNPLSQTNQQFDGAVSAIPLLARQAFRVQGSGADSDRELKLITDALPNRWSFDATNKERFHTLDSVLRGFIKSYGGIAGYSQDQINALLTENQQPRQLPKAPPGRAVPDANAIRQKYGLK